MNIEESIEELKEGQKEHNRILIRLESVIVDDLSINRVGYGTRINHIEKYIASDKKQKWTISGFILAISAFISWIFR